jgi:hypothetical protein
MKLIRQLAIVVAVIGVTACGKPGVDGLRESFARQLASNELIKDFQRSGDDLTFSGPTIEGRMARWRVHIDSAVIESTDNVAQPYKGTVKSSWYSDDRPVRPTGTDSNLPIEIANTGIAQDCWAMWDAATKRWGWE